jgi:putative SOS response-associated peptidase YedK
MASNVRTLYYKLTWVEIVKLYLLRARANALGTDTCMMEQAARKKLATFYARAETVATKPLFRDAFKTKRLLIPASGYYELARRTSRQAAIYFTCRDGHPITFGGQSKDKEAPTSFYPAPSRLPSRTGSWRKCTIARPVVLEAKDFEQWEKAVT